MTLLVLATVAGGSGDIAFVVNAIRCLRASDNDRLTRTLVLLLVKQAAGSAAEALASVLAALAHDGCACDDAFAFVGSAARAGCTADSLEDVQIECISTKAVAPIRCILQGPLCLFSSAAVARSELSRAGIGIAPDCRLVTIREFGQAAFCSPPCDFSSGLAADELGIFALQDVHALRDRGSALALPPYAVGYFRSARHATQFARLALATLLAPSPLTSSAVTATCARATLYLAAGASHVTTVARLVSSLASHPAVERASENWLSGADNASNFSSHVVDEIPAPSPCSVEEGTLVVEVSLWTRKYVLPPPSAPTPSSDGPQHSPPSLPSPTAAAADLVLSVRALPAAGLPLASFRSLLVGALGAVVTGDATLNEGLAAGIPLWYSAEGHKGGVAAALRDLVGVGSPSAGGLISGEGSTDAATSAAALGASSVGGCGATFNDVGGAACFLKSSHRALVAATWAYVEAKDEALLAAKWDYLIDLQQRQQRRLPQTPLDVVHCASDETCEGAPASTHSAASGRDVGLVGEHGENTTLTAAFRGWSAEVMAARGVLDDAIVRLVGGCQGISDPL